MTAPLIRALPVIFFAITATLGAQLPPLRRPIRGATSPVVGVSRNAAPRPQPTPMRAAPMRKPGELIRRPDPIHIDEAILAQLTPADTRVLVSIPKQRAYLMMGEQIVIDAPVSSGKRGHETPTGSFSVREKDPDHHSSLYGDFIDARDRIVRSGVSAQIDSAPSGTHFVGATMKWFMRLTDGGVGMHVGILPGYPASHGCVRMPSQAAELFYSHVKIGTPVEVQP